MKELGMHKIIQKIRKAKMRAKDFDLVVGVGRNGLIPALILASKLKKELGVIKIKFYNDGMKPKKLFSEPRILSQPKTKIKEKRVLLVDDVVRTESTMNSAKKFLEGKGAKKVKRFALVGSKNYCLVKCSECVKLPWN
ncbi:MAG: phosphoribosyltransferase [Candidatus Diapherotrites archaeon]